MDVAKQSPRRVTLHAAPVNVAFDNDFTVPTVQLTAPTEGETLEGTITFTATASDERSDVTKVAFFIDGSQVGTDSTEPSEFSYNTRTKTNGANVLTAKAWDGVGNIGTSASVNVPAPMIVRSSVISP